MREIDPFYAHKLNTKKLLVVLECLKDHAFDLTVFLFTIFTLGVGQAVYSTFVRHYASREVSCGMLTKICKVRIKLFETFVFSPLSTHGVKPYCHRICIAKGEGNF